MGQRNHPLRFAKAWLVLGLTLAVGMLIAAEGAGVSRRLVLLPPHNRQQYAEGLNLGKWPWTVWNSHYLVAHQLFAASDSPALAVYDAKGALVRSGIVWFDSTSKASLGDVTVDPTLTVFASGGAFSSSGALSNFVVKIDSTGHISNTVRTSPFVVRHLCATGDGTVWGIGFDREEVKKGNRSYPMLRQYSLTQGEVRRLVDRESLGVDKLPPDSPYVSLVCNSNTVGALIMPASLWIEVDAKTGQVSRWNWAPVEKEIRLTGLALTEEGDLFATFTQDRMVTGLFRLEKVGSGRAHWAGVDQSAGDLRSNPPIVRLLGSEGNDLVYVKGMTDNIAYWSKVAPAREK